MSDEATKGNGAGNGVILSCKVPGCSHQKLNPEQAFVPAIKAIRQVIGKPVLVTDLADHTVCRRHAEAGRELGQPFYWYPQSVLQIERFEADRTTAKGFFGKYAIEAQQSRPRFDKRRY